MKIIAHRCNLNGPDPERENSIAAMHECLAMGFDVEIDVWGDAEMDNLYLGHNRPVHRISWDALTAKRERLWLHCKNMEALHLLTNSAKDFNFFWHQSDDYALTSKNYIWVYPGKAYTAQSVIVMPEWNMDIDKIGELTGANCGGVCTDYPLNVQKAVP